MNNVMGHVNNVCWLGGTMLHTLTVCKAYPEFKHIVYYVHEGADERMYRMLTDAGVETRLLVNKTLRRRDIAADDPAIVILNNTGGKFVEGEWPFDWLREWPLVFFHHGPTHPVFRADLDIFNSRHLYETRFARCRGQMEAVRFVGSYIDTEEFRPNVGKWMPDRVTIGKLARDQKVKFPPMLARVLESVENAVGFNRVSFEMVGASKYWPKLGEKLTVYQAPDFGSSPAADFYRRWDIFAYATTDDYTETWGRVITEAMACGLPIVAEKKGAIPEQIEHGVDGLLVDMQSSNRILDFTAHLVHLVKDSKARKVLGDNAREKAVREFSIPALRRKTIDALMGVMAGIRIESEA